MSRIGKLPVAVPDGVKVEIANQVVKVNGPKGNLEAKFSTAVEISLSDAQLIVKPKAGDPKGPSQYGLARTLLANLVIGVSEGFSKQLEIHGVGYKANATGRSLVLNLGYSHEISYQLPDGVEAKVDGNVITLSGADKQLVGQAAAEIRAKRKPEPYKGKGIKYADEHVRRKAGKTATATAK